MLISTRYLRELEEQISRSSGRHGLPAALDHSLGGTLFTGDDNVDVPPTPQESSTLLDNQADIGWRSMPIGMLQSFSDNVFSVLIVLRFQGWGRPCIPQRPLREIMRLRVNKTINDQGSLEIL